MPWADKGVLVFLHLCQCSLARGVMFSACPSVCPFVRYQTWKMKQYFENEWTDFAANGPWGKIVKWSTWVSGGQGYRRLKLDLMAWLMHHSIPHSIRVGIVAILFVHLICWLFALSRWLIHVWPYKFLVRCRCWLLITNRDVVASAPRTQRTSNERIHVGTEQLPVGAAAWERARERVHRSFPPQRCQYRSSVFFAHNYCLFDIDSCSSCYLF